MEVFCLLFIFIIIIFLRNLEFKNFKFALIKNRGRSKEKKHARTPN